MPRVWESPRPHFNNVVDAMLTLFEMSTMEDWPEVMWKGTDVTTEHEAMRVREGSESDKPFVSVWLFG